MARRPRLVVPGFPLHIIQRGNNRIATFHRPEDFACYRETLSAASQRYECAIHAYVLMPNHVHLLITAEDARGPSRMMQAVGRRFVRYVNTRYSRTGTLWEGRFWSSVVSSERYFMACSRYVELNPVRAGMVDVPDEYRWSSYRHNALGAADRLITPFALYEELGARAADREAAYRALFDDPLTQETLDTIRHATKTKGIVGDDEFRSVVEERLQRPLIRPPRGGDRRSAAYRAETGRGAAEAALSRID
jgi:REP-associated tyrosine transposase